MALSFALHGAALCFLLAAGAPGTALTEEPAFLVEIALAAPAPAQDASENGTDSTTPQTPIPPEERSAEQTPPAPPEPEEAAVQPDVPPPPTPQPEISLDLPPPDEPPPVDTTKLKPLDPPKPKPPPAPSKPAKAPAKPAVTQTVTAPDKGRDNHTQQAAAQPAPAIVWENNPRFRSPPRPAPYPQRAIELNQQGEARVRVRLDPDGSAAEILLHRSSGFDLLDRAALAAVKSWSFMPAMRDGRAVAAWVEIPVRFHLR